MRKRNDAFGKYGFFLKKTGRFKKKGASHESGNVAHAIRKHVGDGLRYRRRPRVGLPTIPTVDRGVSGFKRRRGGIQRSDGGPFAVGFKTNALLKDERCERTFAYKYIYIYIYTQPRTRPRVLFLCGINDFFFKIFVLDP